MDIFKEVLDLDQLNESTMNDPELQKQLFQLFFDQSPHYLGEMSDALINNETEKWRAAAHALKGSALGIGFFKAAESAKTAEHSTPDKQCLEFLKISLSQAEIVANDYINKIP